MINLVIFGTGKCSDRVESVLYNDKVSIVAYLDNNLEKQGSKRNGRNILSPKKLNSLEYDYVIVSTRRYNEVLKQLQMYHIPERKIIVYYENNSLRKEEFGKFIDIPRWESVVLLDKIDAEIDNIKKTINIRMKNMEYEVAEKIQDKKLFFPSFYPIDKTLEKIVKEKCSLCRFGDGEFELMENKVRPNFQDVNPNLAIRLKEVVVSNQDNILIAIAKNYGSLDEYTDEAADAIRQYMTESVRKQHRKYIDTNRVYHDAYITRPYILRRDKEKSKIIFDSFKKIWDKRDIVIVEGECTRMGVGNDLFDNTSSIKRILAPSVNAFNKYDEILKEVLKINKEILVLISLGPTATVLAYELACSGYQALDIGHLDIEYEWYLSGTDTKMDISNKYVNEVCGGEMVEECKDESYFNQVIVNLKITKQRGQDSGN